MIQFYLAFSMLMIEGICEGALTLLSAEPVEAEISQSLSRVGEVTVSLSKSLWHSQGDGVDIVFFCRNVSTRPP